MRRRFTKAEKAAFTPGTTIEWRNGGHWHPGTVLGAVKAFQGAPERLPIKHTGRTTATVQTGQYLELSPTSVRLPTNNGQ
jgi:hypothetical protein